jgi:hypothetical protein
MYIVRTYSDARFAAYCEHIRGLDA